MSKSTKALDLLKSNKSVAERAEKYLNRKFTREEISSIQYDGGVYDDDGEFVFEVVHEKVVDTDMEKSSVDVEFVIKELSTGKYYKAVLLDSQWIGQDAHNIALPWVEVVQKPITTFEYIEVK